ncbi:unnamed protein product [Rhizophagus irregularis]|nr:unnamed protein product [Rhizophagus irregularis]
MSNELKLVLLEYISSVGVLHPALLVWERECSVSFTNLTYFLFENKNIVDKRPCRTSSQSPEGSNMVRTESINNKYEYRDKSN